MAKKHSGPKGRINITFRTEIQGQPQEVELPLRLMVTADLSKGSSKDRQVSLEERTPRTLDGKNTNDVIKDMGIKVNIDVPNKMSSSEESMNVQLAIDKLESFSPGEVAKQIPQLRALLSIRELLKEIQSGIVNKPGLGELIKKCYADPSALDTLRSQLKAYSGYKVPKSQPQVVEVVENKENT